MNMTLKSPLISCLFIITVVLTLNSFASHDSFKTMDDVGSIVKNEYIRDFKHIPRIFTSPFFGGSMSYYRPLVSFSFMLEYHFVKLNPFYYYITNILIHSFTSCLIFFIMLRLLKSHHLSFHTAFLFAVHPLQWEAVSNIPGRAILLCAFFQMLTFLFFIKALRSRQFYILSLISYALALLSKESAAVFVMVLLSYQFFLAKNQGQRKNFFLPVIPFFILSGIYMLIRQSLGITKFYYWNNITEGTLGFLTFLRSTLTFLRLTVMPFDLQFDRSRELFERFNSIELVFTVVVFAVILGGILKWRQRISPLVWFFLIWPVLELAPVSQIVFSIGVQPGRISTAEHFMYMPLLGLTALGVMATQRFVLFNQEKRVISQKTLRFGIAGFYLYLMLMTVGQNIYSSNEMVMFEQTLALSPKNMRIRNSMGSLYAKLGQYETAEMHFRKSLEVYPQDAWALIGLGKSLVDQGKYWEGLRVYETMTDAGGLQENLETNIRETYELLALKYEQMLGKGENNDKLHFSLAVCYSRLGRIKEAMDHYVEALRLNPEFRDALFNLASLKESLGQTDEALDLYQRIGTLTEKNNEMDYHVYLHMAGIYKQKQDIEKENFYKDKAHNFKPPLVDCSSVKSDVCLAE